MSAVPTVYVAVDSAILADVTLMAILVGRGVYAAGDVPQGLAVTDGGARVGYVEIGASGETNDPTFGTDGHDGVLTLAIRATSKRTATIIYRHLYRILHDKPLPSGVMTADSQALVEGALSYVEDFRDPTGSHNAVARYATLTVSTA